MNHVEWAEHYQREQDYWHNVYEETVYNRVFSYLPFIRPYSLRRRIARWIAEKLV